MTGRFRKGQSGNPSGRPKGSRATSKCRDDQTGSAFDIVLERRLNVTRNGIPRELTVEEALIWKTYQDALAGKRSAQREVMKMILKREREIAKTRPAPSAPFSLIVDISVPPKNADRALRLLEIISPDPDARGFAGNGLLADWAVAAALSRRRGAKRLDTRAINNIRGCTHHPNRIRVPPSEDS